jgi:hypothetical protein
MPLKGSTWLKTAAWSADTFLTENMQKTTIFFNPLHFFALFSSKDNN